MTLTIKFFPWYFRKQPTKPTHFLNQHYDRDLSTNPWREKKLWIIRIEAKQVKTWEFHRGIQMMHSGGRFRKQKTQYKNAAADNWEQNSGSTTEKKRSVFQPKILTYQVNDLKNVKLYRILTSVQIKIVGSFWQRKYFCILRMKDKVSKVHRAQ